MIEKNIWSGGFINRDFTLACDRARGVVSKMAWQWCWCEAGIQVWKDEKIYLDDLFLEAMGPSDLMESTQRAIHIATLILDHGTACAVEKLQQKCRLFPVSSSQIGELCALPDSPLQILDDDRVGLTRGFLVELRLRLATFEGACNTAPRCNGTSFLVPAVPNASLVKDNPTQDLDIKEVCEQSLTYITLIEQL